MKSRSTVWYRRSPVVCAMIFAFVAALSWFVIQFPQKTENQIEGSDIQNPMDQYNSQDRQVDNGVKRKVQEDQSIASRLRRLLDPDQPATNAYVNQQFVQDPISGFGVYEFAKNHYGLTDQQTIAIAKSAADLRLQMANHIVENLEVLENPGDAQRAFVYRGSEEYLEGVKQQLRNQMAAIVNNVFAETSLNALKSDSKLFQGGASDIYFYINPGIEGDVGIVKTVRYEYRNDQGKCGSHWEGPAENLKEGLLLDFDWISKSTK